MPNRMKAFSLKGLSLILSISWTTCVLLSVVWNLMQHEKEVNHVLRQIGKSSIERDVLYRLWSTRHGGVYVPVTKTTQPNPYLTPETTPLRDLIISPDLTLTLINPAYMTRQVYELARETHTISGHITSLNPINSDNKADSWEQKALKAVDQGAMDYSETITMGGQEYFRMLLPLRADKPCLKCHALQGYKEGELRGGISVSLPVAYYHSHASSGDQAVFVGHFAIWAIGMLGLIFGYVVMARGEVARNKAEEQILSLAHFDKLTGLANRNLFQERATQALAIAKRQKKKVFLFYMDLDRFKLINDIHGHEAGDSVLQEVGKRLMASVRETDTVARIGGDEFVVVAQNIDDKKHAATLALNILSAVQRPYVVKGNEHSVGISIGISCFPDDGDDMDTLLKKADTAMYYVKNQAGENFEFS